MYQSIYILLLALLSVNVFGQGPAYTPQFIIKEKGPIKIAKDQVYQFGYLEVPENRKKPDMGTIRLPVYLFKSRNPHPAKDPIIYTVGGPGSSTMPSAAYMKFYQYLDDRDFILFEQRGTYYAQPHLACPEWSEAIRSANLPGVSPQQALELKIQAASECSQRLRKQGVDLDMYNTNESAADIADLRKVLGIDQYNLLSLSYSTKIAQVIMRDYPEGLRSVVMDSPLPLAVNYDEESVANYLASIKKVLGDCQADPACREAFPNLEQRFFAFLTKITEHPLEIKVENPITKALETFYIKGQDILNMISGIGTSQVPNVPYYISQILRGDYSLLQSQLSSLFEEAGSGAGIGMRLSVWCAEEYPFASPEIINRETNKYPYTQGLSPILYEAEVCKIWGVSPLGEKENKAVISEIPTLLITGEYDNETPPEWAEEMQKNLSKSFHLMFKGWKHGPSTNWSNPCAMEAANQFFNNPSKKPDPGCLSTIKAPNFKLK